MHPAPLPGRSDHHRLDGRFGVQVLVGDDQADPTKSPGSQGAQELGPEGPVLGVADGIVQRLPVSVHRHPGRHHHDLVVDPALRVGGVQEHVRGLDVGEAPGPEGPQLLVELGTDAADLGLGDPGLESECGHQVVDLPRRHSVDVSLHDHGEQGPVDPTPTLEDGREEAALAELWDLQVDVSRVPFRWVVRLSVRSKRSDPIRAVASASMRAWSINSTPWRTTSMSPPAWMAARSSFRSVFVMATGWSSSVELAGSTEDHPVATS